MDAAERELFESGIRRATESCSGDALDAALDDLGWSDALADDRRTAVSVLFEAQGRAGVTSSALDQLLGGGSRESRPGDRSPSSCRRSAGPTRPLVGRVTVVPCRGWARQPWAPPRW